MTQAPSGTEAVPAGGRLRILLIEDDPGDALLVEEYVADSTLDVEMRWVQRLADGMAEAARSAPDCILLDLHLPDAMGLGAVSRIQAASPSAAVIVLTGLSEDRAGPEAVASGAQDYLVKGAVTGELLDRAVRYAVHRKQAEHTAAELRVNQQRAQENQRLERGLLPVPMLSPGAPVSTTSCYLPGREGALLGGDFLDVVETADGTVHAVIGDVSGHGPDEAAIGVCLRIAWRSLILGGHRNGELLALMDRILIAERPYSSMFATVATLSIDREVCRADITLAGHDAPLLIENGIAASVDARPGIALGLLPDADDWSTTRVELPPAGALLLHTDGLVEGHAGSGSERLGTEGLIRVIKAAPSPRDQALIDHLTAVTRGLDGGRHLDDIAVLLLGWGAAGRSAGDGVPQPRRP
ncbi:PP2C family protein-serine/threonine phosphatase [Actinacidiphila paucisporea]|uniref:Serine phosphatase RsbU, regulator of sigma subunit n=1 Tax=Actinacidiphila paucisporea TaxID=310782 RepID=A0A1M7JBK8_9ACTN|nr:SpoIIE family protein phosphatase [Actinacidiphila paucisporea]SHM50382.1 Serine phosphatase RsbU, regulator of sigma subunit [Actinacidiphila paucisporea]